MGAAKGGGRPMLTQPNGLRGGSVLAAILLAAALLFVSAEPSGAGLFSWMKGPSDEGQSNSDNSGGGGGLFGGKGLFGGQRQPQQQGSQAFHGDELPPAEGDAATQAWIINPALGSPTLSPRNIEATKAAIEKYKG